MTKTCLIKPTGVKYNNCGSHQHDFPINYFGHAKFEIKSKFNIEVVNSSLFKLQRLPTIMPSLIPFLR